MSSHQEQLKPSKLHRLHKVSSQQLISPGKLSARDISEKQIGSMTIRELGKLDPNRALEELTIKYTRLKEHNEEL